MAIILVVPHILVIFHLFVLIERQRHETIDGFGEVHDARGVFLFHFEDDFVGVGGRGDDFGGEGAGGRHYFGDACGREGGGQCGRLEGDVG